MQCLDRAMCQRHPVPGPRASCKDQGRQALRQGEGKLLAGTNCCTRAQPVWHSDPGDTGLLTCVRVRLASCSSGPYASVIRSSLADASCSASSDQASCKTDGHTGVH